MWHDASVTRERREKLNRHRGTEAQRLCALVHRLVRFGEVHFGACSGTGVAPDGLSYIVLDGDNERHGLCGDLGFADADRKENICPIGELSKLFVEVGVIALTAFISPFQDGRAHVRTLISDDDFIKYIVDARLMYVRQEM